MTCELTFRLGRTRPTRAKSSGSETLLRILFLADCTIDMHDSSFQKRQRLFRADVRRFGHLINKDGVLGTHSSRRKGDTNAQSPLEAVGSLSELLNERGRSLIQIIER